MLARMPVPARSRLPVPHPGPIGGAAHPRDLVTSLQASAGNAAVAQLLAADAPLAQAAGAGNRGLAAVFTAQRDPKAGGADPKAEHAAWDAATPVGGGALYDLVTSDLSIEKLVDMALPELAGLAGSGAGAGFDAATAGSKTPGKVDAIGLDTKEVTQVGEALGGWAQKAAADWLKTDAGKAFLAKAQKLVNDHPKTVYWTLVGAVAAAIGGAVGTYFGNLVDPPEIKKAFEVKGVKIDAAVDLGKFRERILQSAKLAVSTKAGPGTAGIEGSAKSVEGKEGAKGYELGAGGSYTLGAAKVSGGYGYSTLSGQSSANLGLSYKFQPLTLDSSFKLAQDGTGSLDTSILIKANDDLTIGAGATGALYGPGAAKAPLGFKLSLASAHGKESDKITADLSPTARTFTLGTEQVRSLWGGSMTIGMTGGTAGSAVSASYVRDALKADLKYSVDAKGAESVEAGASGKGGGAEAGTTLKYGLTDGQLQKLTTHLGFTTPDETLKFVNDIALEVGKGEVTAKVSLGIKLRLKTVAAELEGSLTSKAGGETGKAGGETGASTHAVVGWKMPAGLTMGVGAGATYAPAKGQAVTPWMVGPELSLGHEALPIRLVGGISVPVGPGSEGLPPVFGLSIAPAFEFGGGAKKK